MNPYLDLLQPYPFERMRALLEGVTPSAAHPAIHLGIGEPQHPTPQVITEALGQSLQGLSKYPATLGEPALREACAQWVRGRYGLEVNPHTQVLPVNGSREALFALAQTVIDPSRAEAQTAEKPLVIAPNPFYQIYEGAAYLAGADIRFAPAVAERGFATDWQHISDADWSRTQLVYVCSPGNPTGAVLSLDEWRSLFELSDRHGFVVAADECYSEIYFRDEPPLGSLEAAHRLGRHDFTRLVMLTSLSKRSNAPGLRSGFVAGDAAILKKFLLYRTYHGCAMSPPVQHASIAAWQDELHVEDNRRLYREKFAQVTPLLSPHMDVALPDAGFYLWAKVPADCFGGDDTAFARALHAQYNVTVLPGQFLAREVDGHNPGWGRVRLALVASPAACVEAAQRMVQLIADCKGA